MTKRMALSCALLLTLSLTVHAHGLPETGNEPTEIKLCDFAPEHDLRIPVDSKLAGGISREEYDRVIDRVEALYTKIVAARGATLQINRKWTSDEVNASATRSGKTWIVNAYGGLARYPSITPDGELMVLCHEMGHHMGGFPRYSGFGSAWASDEGQSDYFATMKCFRRIIENDDNEAILATMEVPVDVSRGCQLGFVSAKDIAICKRSAMTGKVLAQVLYELGRRRGARSAEPANPPAFDTPSQAQVSATSHGHPLAQCRLDTYFAGAICGVSGLVDFGGTEGVTGACSQENRDPFGFRPRCWYKPASGNWL